jgi:hypothetical protein
MRVLITDVTEMHQGNYCVGGWCADRGAMVRPLPGGRNWTARLLASDGIAPGVTVHIGASRALQLADYRTEDTVVDVTSISLIDPGPTQWFGIDAPPTAATLEDAFANRVQTTGSWNRARKGAYVEQGTQVGSLVGVRVASGNLRFLEGSYQGKTRLRACLEDAAERYILPVVARDLRERYRSGGVNSLNQILPKGTLLHVRVGLARAWTGQPGRCAVMINGVYW